ncbi:tRNA cyclic N6-threonylcarbamoyladenosine(37) synthase TcdA [Allohahella marinimesophila]|uniref:tRNA cyclic N6-threonylcarbamoyladenosine(37) synthase TcdA n=2 Tax=Allohahella marinimesophila TaxID=1054972 RepID=A0ABP7PRM2_9GAMM
MSPAPDSSDRGWQERFGGTSRLYGPEALSRFIGARVAVVGLGGVGSWAAESLVRTGIGRVDLFDLDDICVSNTNRQLHATTATIGQMKCEALAVRFRAINPLAIIQAHATFVTRSNLEATIGREYDFVVDAIDSVKHKVALLAYCARNKIPVATAGAAGGLVDPFQLQRSDLSVTYHDALLAKVRRLLRQEYGFPVNPKRRFGIPAVFSAEQAKLPMQADACAVEDDKETELGKSAQQSMRLDCATGYGASMAVTASFGLALSAIALAKLAAKPAR